MGEDEFAEEAVSERARSVALNLGARGLDELVVFHARGARRDAGHATEAVVHVKAEARVEGGFAVGCLLDHVDTAARRIHFLTPENVGGAGGQAEAAVYAIVNVLALGRVVRIETRRAWRSGQIRSCVARSG